MEWTPANDLAAVARIDAVPTILEVVSRVTGMGFAAVARVTEDRWIACAVRDEINFGLTAGGELEVGTTICNEIRQNGRAVMIDHVAENEIFCTHPTPLKYGFQSYISIPIYRPNGEFFGTLCAIDPRPARVNTPETIGMFRLFAELIGLQLDAQDRLAFSEAALRDAERTAELRDQFVAVLGHDLRNPLASISSGMHLLSQTPLDDKAEVIVGLVHKSIARMGTLIDNVLDFARGRLGDGIPVNRVPDSDLGAALEEVVSELRLVWPDREIDAVICLDRAVVCDKPRIAQLFSNLLANALTHGDKDVPIRVQARIVDGNVELSVTNGGPPIPPEMARRIFQPFQRQAQGSGIPGLGLGLFIAAEIARAHEAELNFESTPEQTRFFLRLPVAGAQEIQAEAG